MASVSVTVLLNTSTRPSEIPPVTPSLAQSGLPWSPASSPALSRSTLFSSFLSFNSVNKSQSFVQLRTKRTVPPKNRQKTGTNILPKKTYRLIGTSKELFSSVQLFSCVRLFATPRTAACQASLSITNWNANKNHNEVSLHTCENNYQQKVYQNSCKCWTGCRQNETFIRCWWDYKLVQPLWKTVWRFLKKIKTELSYDPAILFLGLHGEKNKTNLKRNMYSNVHNSTIYNSQGMAAA